MNNKTKKVKSKKQMGALEIILISILIFYSLTFFVALFWGVLTSLKDPYDFFMDKNVLFGLPNPERWSENIKTPNNLFGNYVFVFDNLKAKFTKAWNYGLGLRYTTTDDVNGSFMFYIINTLLYAGVGTLILVFVTCSVAYVCAKYKYRFSEIIYTAVIFTMVIPIVGAQTAMINILQMFNLYNNWIGHFIRCASFASMYFLVFYAFFKDLSNTYNEAAEIDGASQIRVMYSICMPLAAKIMATVFLIMFVANWNDYTTPMLYLPTKPTLSYALFKLLDQGGTIGEVPQKVAALFVLCAPIIVLFIIFKKSLMGNISMGGIKE